MEDDDGQGEEPTLAFRHRDTRLQSEGAEFLVLAHLLSFGNRILWAVMPWVMASQMNCIHLAANTSSMTNTICAAK
jgi:hypothetical protein